MAFDFKKEYKEFYLPKTEPALVTVPPMQFAAVRGEGDPNTPDGSYQQAVSVLYGVSYTIKMSKKSAHNIPGFYDYVVPLLEGLWYQQGVDGIDYSRKDLFRWTAMIRLPEFVTPEIFVWACTEAAKKKHIDTSLAEMLTYEDGRCVQCMHLGSYDDEPATTARMQQFCAENGLRFAASDSRLHHEIYLSDPRKTPPERLKTVIRIPVALV